MSNIKLSELDPEKKLPNGEKYTCQLPGETGVFGNGLDPEERDATKKISGRL